jgi:DNA-binding response OmpR family regulator
VLDDVPLGYELGIAAWLTKPIDAVEFRSAIARLLSRSTSDILIVDDDPATRSLVEQELGAVNARVRAVESGEAALAAFEDRLPEAMVLDLMLPGMDGFEVLRRLREMPGGASTPVVVYTSKDLTPAELEKLNRGLVAVVRKHGQNGVRGVLEALQCKPRADGVVSVLNP